MTLDNENDPMVTLLEKRVGQNYLRQRLGIESDKESRVFTQQGLTFFHIENWYSIHALIRGALRLGMLLGKGRNNALKLQLQHNVLAFPHLPEAFEGFRILQISDLHLDMNDQLTDVLMERVAPLEYDICVMTGDFRAKTFGPIDAALEQLRRLKGVLRGDVYAILGNHDSIRIVPGMESLGYRMLLNEFATIDRDDRRIHIAGIDDPHYYRVDNLEKASDNLPRDDVSILLAHSPEVFMQAAHCGFDAYLCGHTHGGQICLPGGVPLICNAKAPRDFCRGSWRYNKMQGYTSKGSGVSVVDVRFNCPPDVTVHQLTSVNAV